jgi:hypothetical protein
MIHAYEYMDTRQGIYSWVGYRWCSLFLGIDGYVGTSYSTIFVLMCVNHGWLVHMPQHYIWMISLMCVRRWYVHVGRSVGSRVYTDTCTWVCARVCEVHMNVLGTWKEPIVLFLWGKVHLRHIWALFYWRCSPGIIGLFYHWTHIGPYVLCWYCELGLFSLRMLFAFFHMCLVHVLGLCVSLDICVLCVLYVHEDFFLIVVLLLSHWEPFKES